MAEVWSSCRAKSRGEQRVSRVLSELDDRDIILCFSLDNLPAVRDIDLLVVHRRLGIFFLEIKAFSIAALISISPRVWVVNGRDGTENPLDQAYAQFEGFRNLWSGHKRGWRLPPVGISACFPEISRHEWKVANAESEYAMKIADSLVFREDLATGAIFSNRLEHIMCEPPTRNGRSPQPPSGEFLTWFWNLIQPKRLEVATASDRQRLAAIEKTINARLRSDFPPNGGTIAVFSGLPGTGKTFQLLAIGLAHCYAGKRSLFVCFNKTLASDMRRLLQFEVKLRHTSTPLEILDVNQLALRCFERNSLAYTESKNPDEWGRIVVDYIKSEGSACAIDSYDTVLIDEAHDMQDWQLELIRLHALESATVCLAMGKGQELYRDDSAAIDWLKSLAASQPIVERNLKRNFRNTIGQFFAALAFFEAWPDRVSAIRRTYDRLYSSNGAQSQISFDRAGEPIQYIPVGALPGEFDFDDAEHQTEIVAAEFADLISREIDAIVSDPNAHPVGLLILVPDTGSCVTTWVRAALQIATSDRLDVSYIDYTHEATRRGPAQRSEIRLCTYHSSRGLEGERVMLFGLENLEMLATKVGAKPENLAFIALSRALFRTVVVCRSYYPSPAQTLLKEICNFDVNSMRSKLL